MSSIVTTTNSRCRRSIPLLRVLTSLLLLLLLLLLLIPLLLLLLNIPRRILLCIVGAVLHLIICLRLQNGFFVLSLKSICAFSFIVSLAVAFDTKTTKPEQTKCNCYEQYGQCQASSTRSSLFHPSS